MSFAVVLFDDCADRERLMPLTLTRPVGNLRVGMLTLDQKWKRIFQDEVSFFTKDYLRPGFPLGNLKTDQTVLFINSTVLPNDSLVQELGLLKENYKLVGEDDQWIAVKLPDLDAFTESAIAGAIPVRSAAETSRLVNPEDVFLYNAQQIGYDIELLGAEAIADPALHPGNRFVGNAIFLEEEVALQGAVLDTTKGPIFIGKGTVIEADAVIYGPTAIGANCRVKSGAVLYPNVSIGEECTVGGEVANTVIWGRSAKGHLGYLGCAVIGEGCNIGAGTNNSNLRNDWKDVPLYDYVTQKMRNTGLTKCGVIMGDHVMLGIGSKINTGTVIGTGAQIAISNFIPKFVPDFTWLTDQGQDTYFLDRFMEMIKRKSMIKGETVDAQGIALLSAVYVEANRININNQQK